MGGVKPRLQKLDRVLCNVECRLNYHEGFAKVLPRIESDHHPIVILMNRDIRQPSERPFRFITAWTTHPDFTSVIQGNWSNDSTIEGNLKDLQPALKHWNHDVFGNISHRKNKLIARINGIQRMLTLNG